MENNNSNGNVGDFIHKEVRPAEKRRDTVIQSWWTRPCRGNRDVVKAMLYMMALSLAYAHRSGYRVHMHTDGYGAELLKGFGYDNLLTTLDAMPESVPTELFAAGKFFALRAEGTGKVHIDTDVFLKMPGVLDAFYRSDNVDGICQMEEDMSLVDHSDKIQHMHIMGYPATTRPDWRGSMNTGIVGFNNAELMRRYTDNYFEALKIYTAERFAAYKRANGDANLYFDFILEQVELSFLSLNYNVYTLLPTKECCHVADKIGYQHLQGVGKWSGKVQAKVCALLQANDMWLYHAARKASIRCQRAVIPCARREHTSLTSLRDCNGAVQQVQLADKILHRHRNVGRRQEECR